MTDVNRGDIQKLFDAKASYSRSVAEQVKTIMNVFFFTVFSKYCLNCVTVQPGLRTCCADRAKICRRHASGPREATFMAGCSNRKPKAELLLNYRTNVRFAMYFLKKLWYT